MRGATYIHIYIYNYIEDVSSSKVQRISAVVTPDFADVKVPLYDAWISAATVPKSQLEVPVVVNEDENELLLMKTFDIYI